MATLLCTYTHIPFDFIASFLWAPPVATQFSVVWAPPVATLVISFSLIASFLWAPPVATLFAHISFDFIASFLSGHRLWRLIFLFCHFTSDLRRFLEDEPKVAGGLETGFGVQVHPGLDHRWHSEVCEQDSTHTGDALPKEALDYQAAAQQVERRREEESSPGARCLHDIAEKTHPETYMIDLQCLCKLEEVNDDGPH